MQNGNKLFWLKVSKHTFTTLWKLLLQILFGIIWKGLNIYTKLLPKALYFVLATLFENLFLKSIKYSRIILVVWIES